MGKGSTCFALLSFCCVLGLENTATAHQPIIVDQTHTAVSDPEISKGYYGKLSGKPHTYTIESAVAFDLYVDILVPNLPVSQKDVTAEIRGSDQVIATIGGQSTEWKVFFEPYGQSTYWDGGFYKAHFNAGIYEVIISSSKNNSKYVLGIGETESFGIKEIWHTLRVVPQLKRDFFEESPANFIFSSFGLGYVVVMYLLAFGAGFALCRKLHFGRRVRMVFLILGLATLMWAILGSWSPWILFVSGFLVFAAIWRPLAHKKIS